MISFEKKGNVPDCYDLEIADMILGKKHLPTVSIVDCSGGPLIGLIQQVARERRQTLDVLAECLNISPRELYGMMIGAVDVTKTSSDFIGKCAKYLTVPIAACNFLLGSLDFKAMLPDGESEEIFVEKWLSIFLSESKFISPLNIKKIMNLDFGPKRDILSMIVLNQTLHCRNRGWLVFFYCLDRSSRKYEYLDHVVANFECGTSDGMPF
jgi:hypothetical protein